MMSKLTIRVKKAYPSGTVSGGTVNFDIVLGSPKTGTVQIEFKTDDDQIARLSPPKVTRQISGDDGAWHRLKTTVSTRVSIANAEAGGTYVVPIRLRASDSTGETSSRSRSFAITGKK